MGDYGRNDDLGRISRRPYRTSGLDRKQRLSITLGVGAALVLALGVGIGFAVGRATVPTPEPEPVVQAEATVPVIIEETTETVDPEASFEVTETVDEEVTDEQAPPTPKQKSPKDGAVVDASRVYLRWSEVEDDSGEPVTYAFEIQDRLSSGSYGKTQVIGKLKDTSYSARVLNVRRRWRVWAVDAEGNKSDKSGWRYYIRKKAAPKPAPEPSDETT